tara:strand:- start:196 stop:402 length:207 start_codon:yes stop_codon:yes gene_type:complete
MLLFPKSGNLKILNLKKNNENSSKRSKFGLKTRFERKFYSKLEGAEICQTLHVVVSHHVVVPHHIVVA